MSPDKVVLLIIDKAENKCLRGRTLLQKRAYFLAKLTSQDFGFRAHYYGPYSAMIEDGLSKMKALGFIREEVVDFPSGDQMDFETRRYDYKLTEAGAKIVEYFSAQSATEVKKISDALDKLATAGDIGDYLRLSIAAKTHHILSAKNQVMTVNDINSEANKLGWKITATQISEAANFLQKLELAQKS